MSVDQTLALCRSLLETPGVSGDEGRVARLLAGAMTDLGFDAVHTDHYGNVIGVLEGETAGPCVLFDAHLDTVPVANPENWTHAPFGAELVDGRLYGRGASDMKGALAAMTVAAARFAQNSGRRFNGRICVAGVVHEECFEGVAARAVSRAFAPDVVIIGEATDLNLNIGQRGRAEIVVETLGVPAHSASPEAGVNAVLLMVRLLEALSSLPIPEHPVLGQGISVVTDIKSSPWPGASVVPERCTATYDRRLLPSERPEDALGPFLERIREFGAADARFRATARLAEGRATCYTGAEIAAARFFPAWLRPEQDPLVRQVLEGLRAHGLNPALGHYAFCTNGSHYAGEAGIPTLGFGPSNERLAHCDDEYLDVEALLHAVTGYQAILDSLLPRARD